MLHLEAGKNFPFTGSVLSFRLQVAAKYMPVSQLIIGIDLAPIKPIPNVITLVDDITTEKCRTDLKRELKTWKADVFLNDGAPNVGSSWVHDAFTQAELVLSALKLATEFLVEGGTFVTKVFRSKDYNSLLWVFKQLFKTVEATKPASSRNVSAEIFVVCRGFLAPSSIDPRFLDPKHVFEELPGKASSTGQSVNILQPEKKQRHRDGYEDGQMIIHKAVPVMDFIRARDPVGLLSSTNQLTFSSDEAKELNANEEIQMFCEDLKVLGRKDFKALLKWRLAQRGLLIPATEKTETTAGDAEEGEEEKVVDPLKELDDLAGLAQKLAKRDKRKDLEKKAKQRLRLQLQMEHGADIADDMHEEGLFNIRALKRKAKLMALEGAQPEPQQFSSEDEDELEEVNDGDYSEAEDSDEEVQDEILDSADEAARWDEEMEDHYKRFKAERLQKDALRYVKEKHAELDEAERADALDGEEPQIPVDEDASDYDSDAGSDDAGLNVDIATAEERKELMGARAERFFSNPIFSALDKAKTSKRPVPEKAARKEAEPEDPLEELKTQRGKKKQKSNKDEDVAEEKKTSGIVFVKADQMPADDDEDYDDAGLKEKLMTDPKTMSLATKLVADRRRHRDDIVDKSFNRFSFGDNNLLPSWFREDESRHNKPQEPITKEAAALIKERMKRLEAAPNKKVQEAKGRNKMRAMKRLEALKRKATVIADSEEIGGRQKSEQIEKIMRAAKKPTKKEKKVVVAKGKLRGVKGRPKGVKGHYKMVDSRSKKDTRAKIRTQKKRKAGRK